MTRQAAEETLSALRACRVWENASDEALDRLARGSTLERFTKNELLMSEGSPVKRFGVVSEGQARVYHLAADGRRTTYEDLRRGGPFGMVAALAGGRSPANVEAVVDGSAVWVPREALLEMADEEAGVARGLLQDLAGRVVSFTAMIQTLSLDVPSRLASYLFQRSLAAGEQTPDGLSVPLGMRKAELAEALGTVPESLSRAFARLRDDGIVDVRGSVVIVYDVGALARLGSGYSEE